MDLTRTSLIIMLVLFATPSSTMELPATIIAGKQQKICEEEAFQGKVSKFVGKNGYHNPNAQTNVTKCKIEGENLVIVTSHIFSNSMNPEYREVVKRKSVFKNNKVYLETIIEYLEGNLTPAEALAQCQRKYDIPGKPLLRNPAAIFLWSAPGYKDRNDTQRHPVFVPKK
ncbi:hypothetical protein [Candidatus Odyssella thessalonicensis]|uniref:hypothetical protein n=1 Tax=Candidatus Odyssella thessalonicensis TaxID=84647 RepID=UPI000225AC7B|nr:hypothetical protein [Candidatus Odyssella thessalonicensis]